MKKIITAMAVVLFLGGIAMAGWIDSECRLCGKSVVEYVESSYFGDLIYMPSSSGPFYFGDREKVATLRMDKIKVCPSCYYLHNSSLQDFHKKWIKRNTNEKLKRKYSLIRKEKRLKDLIKQKEEIEKELRGRR